MKSISTFVARIAGATSLALLGSSAVGCGAEPATDPVGEARSALVGWNLSSVHSTRNLVGTTLPSGYPNCVLAGVQGNFNKGQSPQWDPMSEFSEAGILPDGLLHAHGGAYTDQNDPNARVWVDNDIGAVTTCFDSQVTSVGSAWWGSNFNYAPLFIAAPGTSRQCFLQYLEASDNSFGTSSDFVEVKLHTTTDAQHPTAGWYIEGHPGGSTGYSGWPEALGVCYDLPSHTTFSTTVTAGTNQFATSGSLGNYTYACGLTKIAGPLVHTYLDTGVYLDIDSSGLWRLHAYDGQSGTAACVHW